MSESPDILSFDLDELLTPKEELKPIFELKAGGRVLPLYPLKYLPEKFYLQYKTAQAQEFQLQREFISQMSQAELDESFDKVATATVSQYSHAKGDTSVTVDFKGAPYKVDDEFIVKGDDTSYKITEVQGTMLIYEPAANSAFAFDSTIALTPDLAKIEVISSSATIADIPKIEAGSIVPRRRQLEAVFQQNPNAFANFPPVGLQELYKIVQPLLKEGEAAIAKAEEAEAEAQPDEPQVTEGGKAKARRSSANNGSNLSELPFPSLEPSTDLTAIAS
jgi:hypothetical protein